LEDPATFNDTVEPFLRTPFVKKARMKGSIRSLEKMRIGASAAEDA
jgi:hypothetical protein